MSQTITAELIQRDHERAFSVASATAPGDTTKPGPKPAEL